jgi:hypothetical protein
MRGFKKNVIEALQKRCQSWFQPYGRAWHKRHELHTKWTKHTSGFIKKLICCAFCGISKMNNQKYHYKILPNTYIDACNQYLVAHHMVRLMPCLQTIPPMLMVIRWVYAWNVNLTWLHHQIHGTSCTSFHHISTPLCPPIHYTSSFYHS